MISGALVLLLMSSCAAVKQNAMVDSARETFVKMQSDPDVNRYAPLELEDAKVAIAKTEQSWQTGADLAEVEHFAYLARQKALIAGEIATMKIADKKLEEASAERNKVQLAARSRELEQSLSQAEMSRQEAEVQRRAAEDAQKQAQLLAAETEKERLGAAAAEARARKLEAELAELQARQTERGLVLTLGDVLFDTGKSDLKAGAHSVIDKMAAFMNEYPARIVQIEGFTDSVGSDDYNLSLSIRRAEAVRNALSGRGIGLERLMYHGYGEAFPMTTNDTADGRQRNRRVEIVISDEKGVIAERAR